MIYTNIKEGTPRWHAQRAKGIGGSEVAGLFGVEKRTYGYSEWLLYQVKGGFMAAPDFAGNTRTEAGRQFEDAIIRTAATQEGWELRRGGYAVCDRDPRARHSLDRQVVAAPERFRGIWPDECMGPGLVEAKMVSRDQQFEEYGWNPQDPRRLTPPSRHMLQVQHGLLCTGFAWAALVCGYAWDNVQVYYTRADTNRHEDILRRIALLYDRIERQDPPPVDGNETTEAAIKKHFARPSKSHFDIAQVDCEEADEDMAQFLAWRESRKHDEQQETLYGNKIRNRLSNYETMQGETHFASWKLNKNQARGALRVEERSRK